MRFRNVVAIFFIAGSVAVGSLIGSPASAAPVSDPSACLTSMRLDSPTQKVAVVTVFVHGYGDINGAADSGILPIGEVKEASWRFYKENGSYFDRGFSSHPKHPSGPSQILIRASDGIGVTRVKAEFKTVHYGEISCDTTLPKPFEG